MKKVFDSWQAVRENHTKDKVTLEVTGREIEFDKSVFPTSIKIGGNEILYSPIRLSAEFSDVVGQWKKQSVILTGRSDETVRFSATQTAENLIVNADISAEFDGLVKINLTLVPFWSFDEDNKVRLTKMYIDVPIKKEYGRLFHFWPNCESGVCLSGRILNSFALEDGETALPFKPYIWSGREDCGLGICCESDKGFESDDASRCIVIENKGYVNIRISLLDHTPNEWSGRSDSWGNNVNPISYCFGFQPTPVKEFDKDNLKSWRAFHLYDVAEHDIFDRSRGRGEQLIKKLCENGMKWLILHEDWSVIQNYGLAENEDEFKAFVTCCHKAGLKVMVYFGYELSSLYPGFADNCGKWLNKNDKGNFVGGWQREPMQRAFTVCYSGGYSDVFLERVKYAMDEYGVDGIYTDGTYVPWECANAEHGCGRVGTDGKIYFEYPIFAVREHVKKLYSAVHERGGIIDTHQSSCCLMATLAFADSYFDGENLQDFMRENIRNMRLDTFRTEFMGRNMGIPCNFISYTSENMTIEKLAGLTMIHSVFPRANRLEDIDYIGKLYKIYDDFDCGSCIFNPYWEQSDVVPVQENVYASYYKKDNELLIFLLSYNESTHIDLKLDDTYSRGESLCGKKKAPLICGVAAAVEAAPEELNVFRFIKN